MTIPEADRALLQASPVDAALGYASLGWPVFPLVPGTKVPFEGSNGHLDAITDADRIRAWWTQCPDANIGVDLERAGLLSVAPDSLEWLAEFERRGLPDTWAFESGSGEGHRHYLYRRPEAAPLARRCPSGKFDILSEGYAILPPSRTTGPYRWLTEPNGIGPVEAPAWAIEELSRARSPGEWPEIDPDQPPVRLDEEDERRWRGELVATKRDGSVDRSKSLMLMSFPLAAAGLSERGVAEALRDRDIALGWHKYSDRGDDREYVKLAVEAVAVQRWGAGLLERVRLGLPIVKSTAADDRKAGATDFLLIDFPDTLNLPVAAKLIDGFLPERSLILNSATRGSYKSAATNGIGVSLVTGLDWLGRKVLKPGPVVYVLAEGRGDLSRRNAALIKHLGLLAEQLRDMVYLLAAPNLSNAETVKRLLGAIDQRGIDPVLVVIDTLARTFGGGNENQQQDMNGYVDGLYLLHESLLRSSILTNHHFNRDQQSRGSSVLLDAMDFAFEMKVENGTVRFESTKNRYGAPFADFYATPRVIDLRAEEPPSGIIQLRTDETTAVVLEPCGAPERKTGQVIAGHKLLDSDRKLLAALRDEPTGRLAHGTWGEAAGVHKQTVNKRRPELLMAQLVTVVVVGRAKYYSLTEEGKEVAGQC
jgi:hypothetical protein